MIQSNLAVYPIGIASELLKVHPRTLRLYEKKGLIKPRRRGQIRFYSENDLKWIECIRDLIHQKGLNIEGIKRLLYLIPCWEVKECTSENFCPAIPVNYKMRCWEKIKKICKYASNICPKCKRYNKKIK